MTASTTVQVDTSAWPVLVFRFDGALTVDDVDVYNSALDTALAQGDRFGAVMIVSPAYLEAGRNGEVANKTMKWLKAHRPRLSAQCAGIATVITDDERREAYAQVADQQGEKIYGCPVRTFATLEAAQAWLRAQIVA